jgi:Tfp pilus assembly protein PilO
MLNKLTTTHKWILVLVAIVLVNVVAWMYGLAPAIDRVEAARDQWEQTRQRRDRLQQQFEQLEAIDTDALAEQWEAINPRVPEEGLLREFIYNLVDLTDGMGIPLPSITIGAPEEVAPYFSVSLSASITGDYEQVKAFLHALEEHERLIIVRVYGLSGSGDSINCQFRFSIFAEEFEHLTPYEAPGRSNPFEER